MAIQHNPYLSGIRIEGKFYPLSYEAHEYAPSEDFGKYIKYFIEFKYIEKEYMENTHKIKQALCQRGLEVSLEGYDKDLDTYFRYVEGVPDTMECGMDVNGHIYLQLSVYKYVVGGNK